MALVSPCRQPQPPFHLLERVLKVLGRLTTSEWLVRQHRLQVKGSECPPRSSGCYRQRFIGADEALSVAPT